MLLFSHLVMLDSFAFPWIVARQVICPWDFPGKNTGVGCHFLLQGIFLTQGSNLHLLHCLAGSISLSHQGSPRIEYQFSSVQFLSPVRLFATPWTAAHQASLSINNSQSPLKLMSIESVMPSNHLILWPSPSSSTFSLSQHQGLF